GRLLERGADPLADLLQDRALGRFDVELHPRAEEVPRVEPTEHEVTVRHRRLLAAEPEAGRARMRARALRPDLHRAAVADPRTRAATGADRDDIDARADDRTAADLRVGALEDVAVLDQRDVVARSADVGADHVRVPELGRERPSADDAAGRPRLE